MFLLGWVALLLSGLNTFNAYSVEQLVFGVSMIAFIVLVLYSKGEPLGGTSH